MESQRLSRWLFFGVLLSLLSTHVSAARSCALATNQSIAVPNLCAGSPDGPFCIDTTPNKKPTFVCRECAANCDCPIHQYCIKDPDNPKRGTCKSIADDNILGRSCNHFSLKEVMRLNEEPIYPTKGIDDELVCGHPIFFQDGTFNLYEWLGYCKQGKCTECASWGPNFESQLDFAEENQMGSLRCPGLECWGNELQLAEHAQPISLKKTVGINGSILAFVILITLFTFIMCLCSIRNFYHPRKYKRVTQQL